MADNTKIWPIFRWANWGLSDDLFTGIKNSFYFSNDMEIRTDAKSIFPKPVPAYADENVWVEIASSSSIQRVKNVTYWANDGWWIICVDKTVYLLNGWVISTLCTFSEDICDLELFNWYIYISTIWYLYYKKDDWNNWSDMASATDNTEVNYGRCTDTLTNNSNHPLYATDVCLCVWDTNIMHIVTKEIPDAMQDWFKIQEWYFIRFINELWWFVRVVAVNEPYGSEVLLWDKYSDTPSEVIPLEWYSIIWAVIYNWYHYLLSNKGLGLLNWYQYYLLKKVDWDLDTTTRNCMCVYDDKLYFVANNWIYIYWAKNKNYNDVLWLWHKVEDWYKLWAIGAYSWWIMITRNAKYSSWSYLPIKVWINEWIATTWEVQTMCYFWTAMSEIKQSEYLRVGYHLGKEWANSGDIHIYYRTEADAVDDTPENWQWHPVQPNDVWLSASWDMRSPFATTLKLNCRFQWIQFKFVLTNCQWTDGWVTYTKDTNLYSADLYYNTMLD
jgi:hypothetical protein